MSISAGPTRAAILAGGRSKRMGGAKATAELGGRPLVAYPIEAARAAGLEPFVVAKHGSPLPELDCEILREPAHPSHPLVGILAALAAAPEGVVVVAGDMPFVTAPLLTEIASLRPPAVPCLGGRLEPLLAVYDAAAAESLQAALADLIPLREAVEALGPTMIDETVLASFGEPEQLTFNVNTPDDLRRAERLVAE